MEGLLMMTHGVERFEDLSVFKRARQLSKKVYAMTRAPYFQRDRALQDQVRRAAVSILSNIAEGFERYSLPEIGRFIVYAKASCAELRAQLYVALDAGYITEGSFASLHKDTDDLSHMLGAMRAKTVARRHEA